MKRLSLFALALASGCANGPPQRDVFVPPYAEKGCWARLYAGTDFALPLRELEGPTYIEAMDAAPVRLPEMEKTTPLPLFRDIQSVVVGPHAKLVAYAEPLFREPALTVDRGTSVPDLGTLDFHKRVESFELACER
jgi:hypothetical protein